MDGKNQRCLVIALGIVLSQDQNGDENLSSQTHCLFTDPQSKGSLTDVNWITIFRWDCFKLSTLFVGLTSAFLLCITVVNKECLVKLLVLYDLRLVHRFASVVFKDGTISGDNSNCVSISPCPCPTTIRRTKKEQKDVVKAPMRTSIALVSFTPNRLINGRCGKKEAVVDRNKKRTYGSIAAC